MMTLTHSKLLTALLDGELTRTSLRAKAGVYGSTCTHAIAVMLKHDWITDERIDGLKTRIVEITHEGKRALQRFNRGEVDGPKVAANTISRMTGTYTPQAAYSRNNGNVHIQSHGFGC